MRTSIAAALACVILAAALPAQAQNALRAGRAATPIRLDGRLDESAWMAADSITDLTQVEPHEGGPPSGRTTVRVLVEADAIVIGVQAQYPPGARVVDIDSGNGG